MSLIAHVAVGLAAVGATMMLGVYVVAVLDRVAATLVAGGRLRWPALAAGPLRSAAALVLQAATETERPDRAGWMLASALYAGLAAVALALVPIAPELVVADPETGFVVFSAAVAFVMIAVYLHGWSPDSPFPLHGAYRYAVQGLSLQIPFLLAMLATALPAESLSIVDIVAAQEGAWNVLRQPLGLPVYLLVGVGVSFWGPLDLPDGNDLAGGTSAEASGMDRLLWAGARRAMLVAIAAMGAAGFLGGWHGPWLPGPVWMLVKTLALLVVLVVSRQFLARVRIESFVTACWVVLIPLSLVNIFVAGLVLL